MTGRELLEGGGFLDSDISIWVVEKNGMGKIYHNLDARLLDEDEVIIEIRGKVKDLKTDCCGGSCICKRG